MFSSPSELIPATRWEQTIWSRVREENLVQSATPARLCVATLLPFQNGQPDWGSFERSIRWMIDCAADHGTEIAFVLNADTGYLFQLGIDLYAEVIRRFRASFPDERIIVGVTAVGADPVTFDAATYLPMLDIVQQDRNAEAMIMTSQALAGLDPEACRDAYFVIAEHLTVPGIVHALEPAFVPWARPFGPWLLHELATHPKFTGGKISTLDEPHFLYWAAMCRDLDLDFAPHSGDDYGIASAIRMGLPLLIGAGVSACPLICAARRLWTDDHYDARVYKVFEAFQSLEDEVFRLDENGSAAAYKHSTAHCLHLLGLIESAEVHPDCTDRRTGDESARMLEALRRPLRIAKRLSIPRFQLSSPS